MKNIGVGIEIECIYNGRIKNVPVGEYSDGNRTPSLARWEIQNDSTIQGFSGKFGSWNKTAEFVSDVAKSKTQFFKMLNNFKKYMTNKNDEVELKDILQFNSSCGSHLHFSIKGFNFSDKVVFEIFEDLREMFKEKILNSNIENKKYIIEQYDRSYASVSENAQNFYSRRMERHNEFNRVSETQNKGLEWRSLNLRGVETWREFFEFWEIVFDCLEFLYKESQSYKREIEKDALMDDAFFITNLLTKMSPQYINSEDTIQARKRKTQYRRIKTVVKIPKNTDETIIFKLNRTESFKHTPEFNSPIDYPDACNNCNDLDCDNCGNCNETMCECRCCEYCHDADCGYCDDCDNARCNCSCECIED